MCFKETSALNPVVYECPASVCKSCAYKINLVTGFLEYHGVSSAYRPDLFEDPPTPQPKTTKQTKKADEGASES